jgi:Tfp pilus assembly protein PilN
MMDQQQNRMMGFGIVVAVALAVAVWLYVDGVKTGLEARLDSLQTEVMALKAMQK